MYFWNNKNKPGQVSAVESDYVFEGQTQLVPLAFLFPKHALQDDDRQVLQWIFSIEQANI